MDGMAEGDLAREKRDSIAVFNFFFVHLKFIIQTLSVEFLSVKSGREVAQWVSSGSPSGRIALQTFQTGGSKISS